jgi:small subunit ribosomal protein S19e
LDVSPGKLIAGVAEELKKNPKIVAPEWMKFVKSGAHAERVPQQEDFWFIRCASILRTLYSSEKPVGVQKLRNKYGGKKQHEVSRMHHTKSGGKIIRVAFKQLEEAGFAKKEKFGRIITPAGKALLDKASVK